MVKAFTLITPLPQRRIRHERICAFVNTYAFLFSPVTDFFYKRLDIIYTGYPQFLAGSGKGCLCFSDSSGDITGCDSPHFVFQEAKLCRQILAQVAVGFPSAQYFDRFQRFQQTSYNSSPLSLKAQVFSTIWCK